MSLPTVHAQAISSAPYVKAVSAFPIHDSFEIGEDDFAVDCDFIEFIESTDMDSNKPTNSDSIYTLPSADVYICNDFDEWIEEVAPTCADAAAVPVASTVEHVDQDFYCGRVEGPQIVKAEYYDREMEEKIAKMKGLSLTDKDATVSGETDNVIFAEIIRDFASESYNSWCMQERGTYYSECEVPESDEVSPDDCMSPPELHGFSIGCLPPNHNTSQPSRTHSNSDRKIDLAEQKKKHRTQAIERWKLKRQEKLAQNRLLDPRQVATAKRERTNGKFAKRKINWVSITDASSTSS